ncbi:MAG: dehydrogenase, partial [Pseudomonadota bacterium]
MSRALWHLDATHSELRRVSRDGAAKGIAVQARYSMISTGTERLVACGKVPTTAYDAMSAPHTDGHFGFPIKYGYSLVGHDPDGRAVPVEI